MRLDFSPDAAADIEEIAEHIGQDDPSHAVSFAQALRDRCDLIGRHPLGSPLRPELGSAVRVCPFRSYLIFYRALGETVRVERILHAARDVVRIAGAGGFDP